jgi:hypothetical protein
VPTFAPVIAAFVDVPDVTVGGTFGAVALKIGAKAFAMATSKSELVYKLPRERVAELIACGAASPWDPGHGRVMKEWVSINPVKADTVALAKEACTFVANIVKP